MGGRQRADHVEDVRHGIERGFARFITEGATYLQAALTGTGDFRKAYKGPYDGKHLDSVVRTPRSKTITFKLKTARPDLNWTLAMHVVRSVSAKHDTKEKYDKDPFSCGPYRLKAHAVDKSLTLVRNPHWDPETDPIRNAYPDTFTFEFGFRGAAEHGPADRGPGTDQYAVSRYNGVPPSASRRCCRRPR